MLAIIQIAFNKNKSFKMNSNNRGRGRNNRVFRGRRRVFRNNNNRRKRMRNRIRNNMNMNRNRNIQRNRRINKNRKLGFRSKSSDIVNNKTLTQKINELKNDISKLKLIEVKDPKINSTKKEIRKDKLIDASIMAKYSKMLAFYKTPSKIIKYCAYNKYTLTFDSKTVLGWYPYGYPYLTGKVRGVEANVYTNFWGKTWSGTWLFPPTNQVNINGNYRLISATMKISNISSVLERQGTYLVVKETETPSYPIIYSTDNPLTNITALGPVAWTTYFLNQSFSTTTEKQLYSCNDKAKIVEYNVSEGLNIFQGYDEYVGMKPDYDNDAARYYVTYDNNPVGQNIKYLFIIDEYPKPQSFSFETWQIFEIRPAASSNYAAIATVGDEVFNKDVFTQAKGENNFKIEKL